MKIRQIFLIMILFSLAVFAQETVWVKVDSGSALYLNPEQMQWTPLSEKQQLVAKSYLMVKPESKLTIFEGTNQYEIGSDMYFYIEDIFERDRMAIVAALTRIEAEQLPLTPAAPQKPATDSRTIGLTYGKTFTANSSVDIPYEQERLNAYNWFHSRGYHGQALLILKRMMTKFPKSYLEEKYSEQLFSLYDQLKLYGFLLDESTRLLVQTKAEPFRQRVSAWNELAKEQLIKAKQ